MYQLGEIPNVDSCLNPRSVVRLAVTPHLSYNNGWGDQSGSAGCLGYAAEEIDQSVLANNLDGRVGCLGSVGGREGEGKLLPAPEELLLEGVLLEGKAEGLVEITHLL